MLHIFSLQELCIIEHCTIVEICWAVAEEIHLPSQNTTAVLLRFASFGGQVRQWRNAHSVPRMLRRISRATPKVYVVKHRPCLPAGRRKVGELHEYIYVILFTNLNISTVNGFVKHGILIGNIYTNTHATPFASVR